MAPSVWEIPSVGHSEFKSKLLIPTIGHAYLSYLADLFCTSVPLYSGLSINRGRKGRRGRNEPCRSGTYALPTSRIPGRKGRHGATLPTAGPGPASLLFSRPLQVVAHPALEGAPALGKGREPVDVALCGPDPRSPGTMHVSSLPSLVSVEREPFTPALMPKLTCMPEREWSASQGSPSSTLPRRQTVQPPAANRETSSQLLLEHARVCGTCEGSDPEMSWC